MFSNEQKKNASHLSWLCYRSQIQLSLDIFVYTSRVKDFII